MFPFKERDQKSLENIVSLYSSGGPKTFEINCYMLTYPKINVLITQKEQGMPQTTTTTTTKTQV